MIRIVLLFLFVFSIACSKTAEIESVAPPSPTPKRELKKDIPNAAWVKIYFGGIDDNDSRGIANMATRDGFASLREMILPENDLEVRVWVGFGKFGNDGLVLKRSSGEWTAVNLRRMLCHLGERGRYELSPPKSGWEAMWQKLFDAEILTLPDSSKLKYKNGIVDGKSYVVETNSEYLYQTYEYSNPNYEKLKEAEQMVKIGQIIADEFDLESFSSETGSCGKDKNE